MDFIIYDWRGGDTSKMPEVKRKTFQWKERGGTKKKPVVTTVEKELDYVELNSLSEILDFTRRHNNIMLRRPTEDFPHWYICTDQHYGDFRQR